MIRSFIAIGLTEATRQALAAVQEHLKQSGVGVRWVKPSSIHLTLKFLGNITVDRTGEVTGAMEKATEGISPFYVDVKELGVFPNLRRVQVAWVGLSGELDKLAWLQQQIEASLALLGFARESRAFTPHLTLARVRDRASSEERRLFGQVIANARLEIDYTIAVNSICLMKSQLTREGAIYSRISTVRLQRLALRE